MAERRNSLQAEPAAPRNNKRRRTMMDSVSEVARWLLPSWASEGVSSESSPNQQQTSNLHQAGSSGLSNGERNPKRVRPNESSRRDAMGRLSPVASMAATSTTSAPIEPDFDDGSDSSTSGCSSLSITAPATTETAADTKITNSNNNNSNNQRRNRPIQNTKESKTRDVSISVDQTSIVAETSVTASPSLNFSLFSRPSRALSSTMNSSLPLTSTLGGSGCRSLSSSLHKPERSLNRSIFYEGKTTYGGAAAHRKLNLFSPSPYQMAAKRSKPATNVNVAESSSAAKRLIEALERMNTPVQNAKKIPMGRSEALVQSNEARRKEALESIASLRQIPAPPPPLSTCRTTVQPARIGSNVKPVLPSTEYLIDVDESEAVGNNVSLSTGARTSNVYQEGSYDTADRTSSAGGKMKSAKTIQQHFSRKIPVEEEVPPPTIELPSAPLPIKDLPSFSFATKTPALSASIAAQDSHKTSSMRSPLTWLADFSNKPFEKQQVSPSVCPGNDASGEAFTFAAPVDLDKPTKTLSCKEEFDFKDPLYLKKDALNNRSGTFTMSAPMTIIGNAFTLKTKPIETSKNPAVAEVLSTGSVMDIIGKFESRKDDVVAAAAASSASSPEKTKLWECPQCSVRNPSESCQVCETKKPSVSETTSNSSSTPLTTSNNSWGEQFKKPASSWDCSTCCVNNKAEISKCIACGGAKPGGSDSGTSSKPLDTPVANQWGDLFKKPAGQWTCDTCMVSNKADASKCVACETPNASKAAAVPKAPTSAAPSSLPISTVKSPLSAMIKMAPGWSCDTCLVRNDVEKTKCVACESPKPGCANVAGATSTPTISAFKFGVPASHENKNTSEPVTLVFGMNSTSSNSNKNNGGNDGSAVPNGFKFGVVPTTTPVVEEKKSAEVDQPVDQAAPKAPAVGSGFTFKLPAAVVPPNATPAPAAASAAASVAPAAAPAVPATTSASTAFTGFKFGAVSPAATTTAAAATDATPTAGLFTFGASTSSASSSLTSPTGATAVSTTAPKDFNFGMTTNASKLPGSLPSAATFNFGATTVAPTASTQAPSATFDFGGFSSASKTQPSGGLFGNNVSTTSVFGANTTVTTAVSTQPSASTGFSFTSPPTTGPATTPSITSTSTVPATSNAMFTFGSSNPAAPATTEPQVSGSAFVFGNSSAAASRPLGFNFGATATTTTTTAAAAPPTAVAPTFTFGSSASSPLSNVSNGPALFGSGSLASSAPAFGVPASSSALPFQFNSNPSAAAAPTSTTPFSLNAGSTSTPAAPSSGGLFSFGANSGANNTSGNNSSLTNSATPTTNAVSTAATPFQFMAPAAPTATPAATPAPNDMFNFGQAPSAATPAAPNFQFGAQPQSQTPFQFGVATPNLGQGFPGNAENPFNATTQGRKMRRAVRRRGPR